MALKSLKSNIKSRSLLVGNLPITVSYATGGTITYYNNYIVHTFTSSGTFTPTSNLTADYLVVAGGGGGGGDGGNTTNGFAGGSGIVIVRYAA